MGVQCGCQAAEAEAEGGADLFALQRALRALVVSGGGLGQLERRRRRVDGGLGPAERARASMRYGKEGGVRVRGGGEGQLV